MQNVSTVEFQRDGAFMKKIHLLLSVTELIQSTFTEHRQWPCTLCEVLRRTKRRHQVQILTLSRLQFSWNG